MSWGATAYTPLVTYNEPPFGFHEVITPTDYKRCNEDPYRGTEDLKDALNARFDDLKAKRAERRRRELGQTCGAVEGFSPRSDGYLWKLLWLVVAFYIVLKMIEA